MTTFHRLSLTMYLLARCRASPIANSNLQISNLFPRAERHCDAINSAYYQDIYDCPRKYHMDSNGDCGGKMLEPATGVEAPCTSYCEVKITYSHGKEVPYKNSVCSVDECEIKAGESTTVTTTWEINANIGGEVSKSALLGAFNVGASYSFSNSVSNTLEKGYKRALKQEPCECGYWTWVPSFVDCGALTVAPTKPAYDEGGLTSVCDMSEKRIIHNWCNKTPVVLDGVAVGETFFVYLNCKGKKGVDWTNQGQNDIYRIPGVSTAQDAPTPPTIEVPPVEAPAETVDLASLFAPVLGIAN